MKKLIVMTILVVLMAAPVMALPTVQMGLTSGSVPYTATVVTGQVGIYTSASGPFDTFCLESNEFFQDGHIYEVTVDTVAMYNAYDVSKGYIASLKGDPLDFDTAWLYTQYMNGNAAYQNATAMQRAIYSIEQEVTLTGSAIDIIALGYVTNAAGQWTDLGNVRVMNLWLDVAGVDKVHQSFLVQVPAPGAILLGSIGISFVGWLKRRRSL